MPINIPNPEIFDYIIILYTPILISKFWLIVLFFFFKIVGKKKVLYLQCINMCLETHEQANIYYKSITSKKKKKTQTTYWFYAKILDANKYSKNIFYKR